MAERFVYGTYLSANELHEVINDLISRGVDPNAISLVANHSVVRRLDTNIDVIDFDVYQETHPSRGWLGKIFGNSDADQESINFSGYEEEIAEDYILVVVDAQYEAEAYKLGVANESTPGLDEDIEERVKEEEDNTVVTTDEMENDNQVENQVLTKGNLESMEEFQEPSSIETDGIENFEAVITKEELEENYQARQNELE